MTLILITIHVTRLSPFLPDIFLHLIQLIDDTVIIDEGVARADLNFSCEHLKRGRFARSIDAQQAETFARLDTNTSSFDGCERFSISPAVHLPRANRHSLRVLSLIHI